MTILKYIGFILLGIFALYIISRVQMAAWIDVIEKRFNDYSNKYKNDEKKKEQFQRPSGE